MRKIVSKKSKKEVKPIVKKKTKKEVMASTRLSLKKTSKKKSCPWKIGENYFIRTVTMHLLGELSFISENELVLKNVCWIAHSGRFHDALKNGSLDEVEPFIHDVIVNRGSIVDATRWTHEVPRMQK